MHRSATIQFVTDRQTDIQTTDVDSIMSTADHTHTACSSTIG